MWRLVGVDPAQVRDHLARAGVETPRAPLPVPWTQAERRTITFGAADRPSVLRALFHAYPPGSSLGWGWNVLDDDRCDVTVEDPARMPEALAVIRSAVADPGRIDVAPEP